MRFDVVKHRRSGIQHATVFGKTLCGRYTSGKDWIRPEGGNNRRDVDCRLCQRIADADRR